MNNSADIENFHDGLCPANIGDGECRCLVSEVKRLNLQIETLTKNHKAVDQTHQEVEDGLVLRVQHLERLNGELRKALDEMVKEAFISRAEERIFDGVVLHTQERLIRTDTTATEKRNHLSVKERAEKHGIDLSRIEKQPLSPGYSGPCDHDPEHNPVTGRTYCEKCGTTL